MPPRWLVIAVALALAVAPAVVPQFYVTLLNYIGLFSIVALGLVLLTGVAGQTSFGQAAFVGLGAYSTAWLSTDEGIGGVMRLIAGCGGAARSVGGASDGATVMPRSGPLLCATATQACSARIEAIVQRSDRTVFTASYRA